MRYFTDSQIAEMKEKVRQDYDENEVNRYLACITKIELLDKRNDQFGDCREDLLQAISELQKQTERYVHRSRTDPNDEDADAFEYENF